MTKKLLFIVFTILNISVINATNIKGIITDQKHEAIPFASVFVAGTTIGTTSNESGFYQLALKPGNYTITVKSIGYTVLK
jgi:hypothetical protein